MALRKMICLHRRHQAKKLSKVPLTAALNHRDPHVSMYTIKGRLKPDHVTEPAPVLEVDPLENYFP